MSGWLLKTSKTDRQPPNSDMAQIYPPVSFYFTVNITNNSSADDIAFQEVSGIHVEFPVEEVTEGGENRFKHRLPSPPKYNNLVVKRGAVVLGSPLIAWCKQTLESDFTSQLQLQDITVNLLDSTASPIMSWNFVNAYPVKYEVSNFLSQENSIVIETIEFAYQYFTRKLS